MHVSSLRTLSFNPGLPLPFPTHPPKRYQITSSYTAPHDDVIMSI